MTFDAKDWFRAVGRTVLEPTQMGRAVLSTRFDMSFLWTALALVAVLNVLFVAVVQIISPVPIAIREGQVALSPFALTVVIGVSFVLLVYTVHLVGRWMGGQGDLHQTLTVMVWFYSVNLTLELGQIVLLLLSPALASIYNLVVAGSLIWCIINLINVLHGFENIGKAIVTLILSLVGMAIGGGLVLAVLGITPGGTV